MCGAIVDIGETGLRPNSTSHGLRGRLATTVAHSASEKIAAGINDGTVFDELRVTWLQRDAKELQDALLTLFPQDCGRQPVYNRKTEHHMQPEVFESIYLDPKRHIGLTQRLTTNH